MAILTLSNKLFITNGLTFQKYLKNKLVKSNYDHNYIKNRKINIDLINTYK